MEFNIVGQECHDFENKREFYTRYPIDIVDRVLLFLKEEIPAINEKFHNNKLSLEEKKRMCELLDYFTSNKCPNLETSEINRSYPSYIIDKLSTELPSLSQKMKKGEELTSEEKESVCLVVDELFNCSNYNTNLFKKFYRGKRLDHALKSLKKDPGFFKKFQSDTLSKSQKSDLCYMLEHRLKPTYYKATGEALVKKRHNTKRKRSTSPKRKRAASPKRKRPTSPKRKRPTSPKRKRPPSPKRKRSKRK